MKTITFFLFLLISGGLLAQDFKVTATSQGWAGGICCRHGVNYSVTVTTGKLDIDSVNVMSVCIENKRYITSSLTVIKYKNSFTISFGYAADDHVYDGIDDEHIPKKDNEISCDKNLVIFKLNGEMFSLKIENVTQLPYLAYP
ncbi:MAG: hypothetical protein ACOZCO_08140 [Bacteroidota bacterium]